LHILIVQNLIGKILFCEIAKLHLILGDIIF
jgi:hypothetical protein